MPKFSLYCIYHKSLIYLYISYILMQHNMLNNLGTDVFV